MKIIDTHQHFWNYDPQRHDWINEAMQKIRKNFMPEDLAPILQENKVAGCISVQVDQTLEETDFLLSLAKQNDFIKGVVGWVDLRSANLEASLNNYKGAKALKGFRHIIQGEAAGFMLQPKLIAGLNKLPAYDYTYDLLIYAHQLKEANEMIKQVSGNLRIVIDHIAKPDIKNNEIAEWKKGITALAQYPNVYCKISGMVTEAHWGTWTMAILQPYLDAVVAAFGPNRILFGTDWPVCLVASSYTTWLNGIQNYFNTFSSAEQEAIFANNAIKFYKL